jgi:hypothetical protein
MPEPIATAAVAFIEFTVVKHPFLSLTAILLFTFACFIIDAAPDLNKDDFERKHPFVAIFVMCPVILLYGCYLVALECLGIKKPIRQASPRSTASRWAAAVCRIYAKNVRLAWKVFWAVLLLLTVIGGAVAILAPKGTPKADGGGPESEKFYRFMNTVTAPLQWITNTIRFGLAILAIVFLASLYFTYRVFAFSPVVPIAVAAIIVLVYAVWLWRTTRHIVAEEFGYERNLSHAVSALIPAQLGTWVIFVIFLGATQSAFAWLWSQIPA